MKTKFSAKLENGAIIEDRFYFCHKIWAAVRIAIPFLSSTANGLFHFAVAMPDSSPVPT